MSTDFFPTFCDLLGIARPKVPFDGHSLAALLRGESFDRGPLFCHFPHPMGKISPYPASWVREGDWKLIRLYQANADLSDGYELYNLREDIGETRNRAATEPERVKTLGAKLEQYLRDTHAVLPKPNPAYDPTLNVEIAGWRATHDGRIQQAATHLVYRSLGGDPQMTVTLKTPVEGPLRFEVRMRSTSSGQATIYWTRGNLPYRRERGVFFTPKHDGEWHDYRFELKTEGAVSALRFDPSSGPGEIFIERMRLLSTDGVELKDWRFSAERGATK